MKDSSSLKGEEDEVGKEDEIETDKPELFSEASSEILT